MKLYCPFCGDALESSVHILQWVCATCGANLRCVYGSPATELTGMQIVEMPSAEG